MIMKYRKHRRLEISEVGVGTYSLSGVYGSKDIEEFRRMIKRAFKLGVNFLILQRAMGMLRKSLVKQWSLSAKRLLSPQKWELEKDINRIFQENMF